MKIKYLLYIYSIFILFNSLKKTLKKVFTDEKTGISE